MFSRSSKKRNSSRSGKPAYESQRGQPCNVCGDQCPGFSLHTWRLVREQASPLLVEGLGACGPPTSTQH
ncbi:unnamed protein product [Gadus morhua 'NCC']